MPGTLGARARGGRPLRAHRRRGRVRWPSSGRRRATCRRTCTARELVHDGVLVWDTFWYAGHYPLLSYSLLYYFPAALVGNESLAVVVGDRLPRRSSPSLAEREWGAAARWPARVFAVVACGPLFTGTYPYAARPGRRRWARSRRSSSGGGGSRSDSPPSRSGFSPLAFLFLCLGSSPRSSPAVRGSTATALVVGAVPARRSALVQGAPLLALPEDAEYPFFRLEELAASSSSRLCAPRSPCAPSAGASSPRSSRSGLSPPSSPSSSPRRSARTSRACAGSSFRSRSSPPRSPATGRAGSQASPSSRPSPTRSSPTSASSRSTGRTRARRRRPSGSRRSTSSRSAERPSDRVEVVPTGDHWEAYWLPRAGFPLARGWYRQLDIAQNPLFYEEPLEPADVPRVARLARRPLGAPARHAARPGRGGAGGRAAPLGRRRPRGRGSRRATVHRLRGARRDRDPDRPGRGRV